MDKTLDRNTELMLDGNAAGGVMMELFGVEMTAAPTECATCGTANEWGALRAFMQAPGIVLRCPVCQQVMLRIVQTPEAVYLDARGAAYMRIERRAA